MKTLHNDEFRHRFLEFLTKPLLNHYGTETSQGVSAKSFNEIETKFDLSREKIWEVASELIQNEEITYYNTKGIKGFIGLDKGLTAWSGKKYLYRNAERKRNNIKYYVSIYVPLVSLLIATLTIISKFNSTNDTVNKRFKKIEYQIKLLQEEQEKSNEIKSSFEGKNKVQDETK